MKGTLTTSSLPLHYLGHIVPLSTKILHWVTSYPPTTIYTTIYIYLILSLSDAQSISSFTFCHHCCSPCLRPTKQTTQNLLDEKFQYSASVHTNGMAIEPLFLKFYNVLLNIKISMIIYLTNCSPVKEGH